MLLLLLLFFFWPELVFFYMYYNFIPLGSLVLWFQYLIQRKRDLIATFLCVKIWNGTIPHGIF